MKLIKSFGWAINGLRSVWREELNFKIEILISIAVIAVSYFINCSTTEIAVIILCCAVMLSAEVVNTVIEDTMDFVNPEMDPTVGKIKDMMAGFVLIASLGTAITSAIIIINKIING